MAGRNPSYFSSKPSFVNHHPGPRRFRETIEMGAAEDPLDGPKLVCATGLAEIGLFFKCQAGGERCEEISLRDQQGLAP